ncbi:MAG: lipoprotein signal peptidase [Bacteroidota bacterium]
MLTESVTKKRLFLSAAILFLILLIDQWSKWWVKTHMYLGEDFRVLGDWFHIHFTENYGMAFGLEFGGSAGKFFLSGFRILASCAIGWYIVKLARENAPVSTVISFTLILAGAIGNIIDSAFYGVLFSDSIDGLATLCPPEGGYAGFLQGRVVDMLYFPLFSGTFPEWLPFWSGEPFLFFRPVFNIADSSITIGVIVFLLTQRKQVEEKQEDSGPIAQ